jgi:hypothetical protein
MTMHSINRLFKVEGWLPVAIFLTVLGIGLVAAFVAPLVLSYLDVDRCLDAGGAYNYESNHCVYRDPRR